MASVTSLGLHRPSALPYLVSESILPPDPTREQYRWTTTSSGADAAGEEELLVTDDCVVWTQSGLVRKVFRFEVDDEKVSHAVLTSFPTRQATQTTAASPTEAGPGLLLPSSQPRLGKASTIPSTGDDPSNFSRPTSEAARSRALVVFLRTQAHVYFLSGTSHVVHLPFEVDSVLAAPNGLLIQRKSPPLATPISPVLPSAPWPSLRSSQPHNLSASTLPALSHPHLAPAPSHKLPSPLHRDAVGRLPRSYALTDPLLEMGLVVTSDSQKNASRSTTPESLSPAERLLYISSPDEFSHMQGSRPNEHPTILALTVNRQTDMYSIWTVSYLEPEPASSLTNKKSTNASGSVSRRRSSFGHGAGTGATTPALGPRESTGGRGQSLLGPSDPQLASLDDDPLASTFDVELDFDNGGPPAKQSRRVSSLLARADLSSNQDRFAFSELASGHAPMSTNLHPPGARRGESLGSYNHRGSLGKSFGSNRRDSMPSSAGHRLAPSGSFHDLPVDNLLDELNAGGDFEGFEGMGLHDAGEGLRKEVLMRKVESVPTRAVNKGSSSSHDTYSPKIFSLVPSQANEPINSRGTPLALCVVDVRERSLLILTLEVPHKPSSKRDRNNQPVPPGLVDIWRGTRVIDAVKLVDRNLSRILVLGETEDGHGELTLRGPWDYLMRVDMPSKLAIFDLNHLGQTSTRGAKREGSLKRVVSRGPRALLGLEHASADGQVDVVDEEGRRHRIQIHMQARDSQVAKMLDVCRFVLPSREQGGEGVLMAWWEVRRWLRERSEPVEREEWTALVVVLMSMAVEFMDNKQSRTPLKPKKRTASLLRSSSGAKTDQESWEKMLNDEGARGSPGPGWMAGAGWQWIVEAEDGVANSKSSQTQTSAKSARSPALAIGGADAWNKKNTYLVDCVNMAHEFLQTPMGAAATGKHGYLLTAKDRDDRQNALPTILVGLHLYREELKLHVATSDANDAGVARLTPLLAQLGGWLGWQSWSWREQAYYSVEDAGMNRWLFDAGVITRLEIPARPFEPPSIYDWLSKALQNRPQSPFHTLRDVFSPGRRGSDITSDLLSKPAQPESWLSLTPRTAMLVDLFSHINAAPCSSHSVVEKMAEIGFDKHMLDTLPEGVVAPLREAMVECQANPATTWREDILNLLGRDDLRFLLSTEEGRRESSRQHATPTHEAARDVHSICATTFDTEAVGSFDGSAEVDRQAITRLIFREDRRFVEASKLLQSGRTSMARCPPEPEWSESDLLDAQKELAQTVAIRTLAVPAGRGLLYFSARLPLLTEKFPITGFNLSCVMRPSNNTVSADKSAFTEEKVGWAFFHSGVAAGLSISREARGIDTSWIVFNKPAELSNRHAGFLLALGLNGHLKSIAKWVAFKYLTPKHTMTSIGLLLGLSASYLGTMDTLVTKLLSVHVSRMLPPGAAELNLSPLTQTTGIMGIGLLYCNTQHRRMSEVMLSEIEHVDYDDSSTPIDALRDEGYRLAAGFSLGFINLGKGKDLKGLHDMHLVERLLAIAVANKKVSIVHVLDKSTAAATIAIALIFLKSGDEALARKIDVPDTLVQFDYVRPDIFLLRTVAKHLIMWKNIQPTDSWIKENLPKEYRPNMSLQQIRALDSEDLPLINITAGLCFSIGLRFAGSASHEVRNVLVGYLDQFIRLCRLNALNYDQKLTRSTVRNCQDLLALSCATVMAGTGDVHVFRRLRSLHGRTDPDTPYGSHLAAHIAIGVLFLGGGNFTLGTSPLATAALLCAFYPLFPNSILDNKSHLQAFRHFWVLAAEARCIVARDVATYRPVSIPLSITLNSGKVVDRTAPCLLPPISEVAAVATTSPDHWRVVLDFAHNAAHRSAFTRSQTILVRQRAAAHDASACVFRATLRALDDTDAARHSLEWLFELSAFAGFDRAERALVLPPDSATDSSGTVGTEGTLVDARLMLEQACIDTGRADRLRNLKLLFDWADRREREGRGPGRWIAAEVVDRLRARVWLACQEEENE